MKNFSIKCRLAARGANLINEEQERACQSASCHENQISAVEHARETHDAFALHD